MTLCDGESLPVSSLTFDITSSETPPTICASPSKRRKDFDWIWLLKIPPSSESSLPPRMTWSPAAASFEGSTLLCNDYRHASPPARSESWGVVDVQADFAGLAINARIAPHKTGYGSVPHRPAKY